MSITTRIDRIARIPPEARRETPPPPRSVKIELTARCNYRCVYCALATRGATRPPSMDWPFFQRLVQELREDGVEEVGVFLIGESFMAPALLVKAIRYLVDVVEMPYVFLTTNGSLASPAWVERVMAAGLHSLKWSINAGSPRQFAQLTGAPAPLYHRTLEHLQAAWALRQRHGYATRLYASSIRYDDAQQVTMRAVIDAQIRPYVDEHYWLPLYSMGSLATAREASAGYRPGPGNIARLDAPVDPLPCWSCFTEGHVLVDGRLSACCFDATGQWVMGDLTTQSFREAWHSAPFRALRRAHLDRAVQHTICADCLACGGVSRG